MIAFDEYKQGLEGMEKEITDLRDSLWHRKDRSGASGMRRAEYAGGFLQRYGSRRKGYAED